VAKSILAHNRTSNRSFRRAPPGPRLRRSAMHRCDPLTRIAAELVAGAMAVRPLEALLLRAEAEALAYLATGRGFQRLGFASLGDLGQELLDLRPRTVRERLLLHRLLSDGETVEQAFLEGRLSSCQVLALSPVLQEGAEEDVEGWIQEARDLPVRELRRRLRRAQGQTGPSVEGRVISFRAPRSFAAIFDQMMELGSLQLGREAARYECIEAILAEAGRSGWGEVEEEEEKSRSGAAATKLGRTGEQNRMRPGPIGSQPRVSEESLRRARETLELLHEYLGDVRELMDSSSASDPEDALLRLVQLRRLRAPLRMLLARLLHDLRATRGMRCLGFDRLYDFVTHQLGLSERCGRDLAEESFLFEDYPALGAAYGRGEIGVCQAHLINSLIPGRRLRAFLVRARELTYRQFAREVRFALRLRRYAPSVAAGFPGPLPQAGLEEALIERLCGSYGWTEKGIERVMRKRRLKLPEGEGPHGREPSQDPAENPLLMDRLEALLELLGASLSDDANRQTSATRPCQQGEGITDWIERSREESGGSGCGGSEGCADPIDANRQTSATCSCQQGEGIIRFWAPREVAADWSAAIESMRKEYSVDLPVWAAALLIFAPVAGEWSQQDPEKRPVQEAVLIRDSYRCRFPGCTARSWLEVHHVKSRGQGGSDRAWNKLSLCHVHHQHVIHRGYARVKGRAPHALHWEIGCRVGRPPLLTLKGEKVTRRFDEVGLS